MFFFRFRPFYRAFFFFSFSVFSLFSSDPSPPRIRKSAVEFLWYGVYYPTPSESGCRLVSWFPSGWWCGVSTGWVTVTSTTLGTG